MLLGSTPFCFSYIAAFAVNVSVGALQRLEPGTWSPGSAQGQENKSPLQQGETLSRTRRNVQAGGEEEGDRRERQTNIQTANIIKERDKQIYKHHIHNLHVHTS